MYGGGRRTKKMNIFAMKRSGATINIQYEDKNRNRNRNRNRYFLTAKYRFLFFRFFSIRTEKNAFCQAQAHEISKKRPNMLFFYKISWKTEINKTDIKTETETAKKYIGFIVFFGLAILTLLGCFQMVPWAGKETEPQ